MHKLVLVRHGITTWSDKFTGWTDVDIEPQGIEETKKYAVRLKEHEFVFDVAYTSYLKRAIKTIWTVLETIDQMYIPVEHAWQLNERHYGALQGLNKAETAAKYGDEQVEIWRRSYDIPPPKMELDDPHHPRFEKRYSSIPPDQLPNGESLKDTLNRALPYWNVEIAPAIKSGKQILLSAHHNSMRALIKHIEGISDEDIVKLNIAYCIPLVYELDNDLTFIKKYYLASDQEVQDVVMKIKNQAKKQ